MRLKWPDRGKQRYVTVIDLDGRGWNLVFLNVLKWWDSFLSCLRQLQFVVAHPSLDIGNASLGQKNYLMKLTVCVHVHVWVYTVYMGIHCVYASIECVFPEVFVFVHTHILCRSCRVTVILCFWWIFLSFLFLQLEIKIPTVPKAEPAASKPPVDVSELKMRLERIKKMATSWWPHGPADDGFTGRAFFFFSIPTVIYFAWYMGTII